MTASKIAPVSPQDWTIHVNRGTIDANRKHGRQDAPLKLSRGRSSREPAYGHEIKLYSPSGEYVGRFAYDPAGILPCGAKVVLILAEGVTTEVADFNNQG